MMKTDIAHIYNKVYRTALMMLCLVAFFSCVKVDVCSDVNKNDKHIHTGSVKIVYNWEGVSERPDSMLALVNRVVNTHRIGYVTDAESSVYGRYFFGRDDEAIADVASSTESEPLIANAGEYQIYAFNIDAVEGVKEGLERADYRVSHLSEFGDDDRLNPTDIREVEISYVGRGLDEKEHLNLYAEELHSFNPELKYIPTDIKPIYRAVNQHNEETQEYTFGVHVGQESVVDLYPQTMMQDITFSFPVFVADNVTIADTLVAEISGIPHKMMFHSGLLDIDTVYKMQFKVGADENSVKDTTKKIAGEDISGKEWNYSSTISIMGLVANKKADTTTGAGILLLCVDVDGNNQYVKMNLYNTINEANLLLTNPQGTIMQNPGTYHDRVYNDTLKIDSCLNITEKGIEASKNGTAVDSWAVIEF